MTEKILCFFATIIASCLVMVLHEMPKTIIYQVREGKKGKVSLLQYIDPIGLIFSVTGYCGFSKPYMYRIKDKKSNLILGYAGLVSLFFLFIISLAACKYIFGPAAASYSGTGMLELAVWFPFWVMQYMSVISLGMLLANLFPIVPFDMGNLIAGYSSRKYISILRNDYFIKMIYFVVVILGIIKTFSVRVFLLLYR